MKARAKIKTYFRLGMGNVARVAFYRLGIKTGLHPVLWQKPNTVRGPFFTQPLSRKGTGLTPRNSWQEGAEMAFGLRVFTGASIPKWFEGPKLSWHKIPDFATEGADIKNTWEASRFDWLIAFAQRAALGKSRDLEKINTWLEDWITSNPGYLGPNWKCGQEASIRVMRLAIVALIFRNTALEKGLRALLRLHLIRIAPTMGYAIGQANNHGTSEAAALFIGGSWLGDDQGKKWAKTGRKWLENRAQKLIEADGTFSQYSVNYQRFMIETYCLSELWRQELALPEFSATLALKLGKASHWLRQFTSDISGDAANLGANDGAQLLALKDGAYRDFRPAIELARILFCDQRAYGGKSPEGLGWVLRKTPKNIAPACESETLADGGFHVFRQPRATAYLRFANFNFRPSQADILHCDLWVGGKNILRDCGTYSYALPPCQKAEFDGVAGHNTIQFNALEQMPRMGRFLFANWPKALSVLPLHKDGDTLVAGASFIDQSGAVFERKIQFFRNKLVCSDQISGFDKAVLRWHLPKDGWVPKGRGIVGNGDSVISILRDGKPVDIEISEAFESRFYLQKNPVTLLKTQAISACGFETTVEF